MSSPTRRSAASYPPVGNRKVKVPVNTFRFPLSAAGVSPPPHSFLFIGPDRNNLLRLGYVLRFDLWSHNY